MPGDGNRPAFGNKARKHASDNARGVPSDQLADSDEARTFQLELRIENPDFAAGFIEEYKTENERDLERFCQPSLLAPQLVRTQVMPLVVHSATY